VEAASPSLSTAFEAVSEELILFGLIHGEVVQDIGSESGEVDENCGRAVSDGA
jgi:hypothetical protein